MQYLETLYPLKNTGTKEFLSDDPNNTGTANANIATNKETKALPMFANIGKTNNWSQQRQCVVIRYQRHNAYLSVAIITIVPTFSATLSLLAVLSFPFFLLALE